MNNKPTTWKDTVENPEWIKERLKQLDDMAKAELQWPARLAKACPSSECRSEEDK
jgi:hypothetical protein